MGTHQVVCDDDGNGSAVTIATTIALLDSRQRDPRRTNVHGEMNCEDDESRIMD